MTAGRDMLVDSGQFGSSNLVPLYQVVWEYRQAWFTHSMPTAFEGASFSYVEGRVNGSISARLRGTNHSRRVGDGSFRPDVQGVLELDDGTGHILFDYQGFGCTYPSSDRRRVVISATHSTQHPKLARLNDCVCVGVGENRESSDNVTLLILDLFVVEWQPLDHRETCRPTIAEPVVIEPWFRSPPPETTSEDSQ